MDNAHPGYWYMLSGDCEIKTIGRIKTTNMHPNRVLPFWVLTVINSGQRTIQVGDHIACLTTGDYCILPANIYHCGIEEDKHDAYFVHFNMKGISLEPPSMVTVDDIIMPIFGSIPKETDILRTFNYIYDQYQSGLACDSFLHFQLKAMLYQISLYMQKKRMLTTRENHLGDELYKFISMHLAEDLDYRAFEQQFKLSYRQLNVIFKKQFNTTIRQKMIELRVNHASNLLMLGESIAYAAEKSGFNDYFYFIKCFKKIKDISPNALKKKYLSDAAHH